MNKLFKHIKSHKGWYGLGVVVLLLVGVLAYARPGELGEELAGRLDRVLRKPVIRKEVQVTKPTKKLACTEADWSCTAFEPAECPPSGERTRTCTLTNRQCTNPNAVKPAETESCTYEEEVAAGNLSIGEADSPNSEILIAGSQNTLVAQYKMRALGETIAVEKLTVMNDSSGAFDQPVGTSAVSSVKVQSGGAEAECVLSGGKCTLSNLNLQVPQDGEVTLKIYADVAYMAQVGESLSGQTFRLGVQDTNNTTATFSAVGQLSGAMINPAFSGGSSVNDFVVRKSQPTFTKAPGLSSVLINGTNRLYGLTVAADNAGSVSFGRLFFGVNPGVPTPVSLSNFRFYRGSTLLSEDHVNIYHAPDTGSVIISFNNEETIAAGSSQTYYLEADVMGATVGSFVAAILHTSDEGTALTGLTANTNPNTGKIYSAGNPTSGIFSFSADDFSQLRINPYNIIWSDKSADYHMYPTISAGVVTSDTGSYDWTNGYLLNMGAVTHHRLDY